MKYLSIILLTLILTFGCIFGVSDKIKTETSEQASSELYLLEGLDETQSADITEEYRLTKTLDVVYGKIYKYQQQKNGLDVYGKELVVSVNKEGKVLSTSGEYLPLKNLSDAKLGERDIVDVFTKQSGKTVSVADKIIYPSNGKAEIAYEVVCADESMQYVVSATDGKILRSAPVSQKNAIIMQLQDADGKDVTANIEYVDNKYKLADYTRNIYTLNANNNAYYTLAKNYESETGEFDPIAVSAYTNVIKAYDFYADEKNIGVSLRGVNGGNDDVWNNSSTRKEEIPIMVYVHYDKDYENANCGYNPSTGNVEMLIGDGRINGVLYQQAKATDIIAHEYQHAVTHFAANLTYMNDSGALDEAFSDIFGMLVEGHDPSEEDFWRIGETATTNDSDVRSVKGGTRGQSYHVKNKVPNCSVFHDHTYCDYGGTHQNSTIISHVQYRLSQARPDFFTRERIGQLWYSTLCALTSEATFDDFAEQFYQSAVNLGFDDDICRLVRKCLSASGLLAEYTVTFLDNDGKFLGETQVVKGENAEYPEIPMQKTTPEFIMDFIGWSAVPENVTEDMTISAEYILTRRSYKVTFYGMNETILGRLNRDFGDKINPPPFFGNNSSISTDAYTFDGWYYDEEFTTPVSDTDTIDGETTLYGKWTMHAKEPTVDTVPEKKPKDTPALLWLYISLGGVAFISVGTVSVIILKKRRKA